MKIRLRIFYATQTFFSYAIVWQGHKKKRKSQLLNILEQWNNPKLHNEYLHFDNEFSLHIF